MIEIITDAGISLDLDPAGAFEIEIEQPLLDDTHIPIPYSTSISFLPTAKNKDVFGFLDAMMMTPTVTEISATVCVKGVTLFYGTLEYDGLEDGKINYTFSGRNLEDTFSGYIHKVEHLTKVLPPLTRSSGVVIQNHIDRARNGTHEEFGAPVLIGQANITDIEYENDRGVDPVSPELKYHNWVWDSKTIFTPAVRVCKILSEVFKNVTIDYEIKGLYDNLAILGLYKDQNSYLVSGLSPDSGFDIANTLPECTILDLVTNIAKMFCASIFRNGDKYIFRTNQRVIENTSMWNNILDWNDKVSDRFTASIEKASSYIFGYSNDDSENTYDPTGLGADIESNNVVEEKTMFDVMNSISLAKDYIAVRHTGTGDMFSGRGMYVKVTDGGANMPFMDMLLHNIPKVSTEEEFENSYDSTVDFKCVRCMPAELFNIKTSITDTWRGLCPIVEFPAIGDDRSSEVWIGLLLNNQLVDKGYYLRTPELPGGGHTLIEENTNQSLAPKALYEKLHRPFAEWLAKDRQVISADVNLTLDDIVSLRMYNKVVIRSRAFLIKKITLSFAVNSDSVEATADFIEC